MNILTRKYKLPTNKGLQSPRGLFLMAFSAWLLLGSVPDSLAQQKLTILHTNDLHSSLLCEDTPSEKYNTVGGVARIATLIKNEQDSSHNPIIVLDAGDFLMGTLFQVLEPQSGFQLHLMKEIGYDAVALGNHEFDFGIDSLVNYAEHANNLGAPTLLCSNLGTKEKKAGHQDYNSLLEREIVKPYKVIEKEGIRIGIFSLLGREAFRTAPNAHILGRTGSVRTARKMVKTLKQDENVDVVICLSHGGIYTNEKGDYLNREDIRLAKKVKGIDVIISGHTHSLLTEPLVINGTPIIQVQDKGQFVGKLTLNLDDKNYVDYELLAVTHDIEPDPMIRASIAEQYIRVKDFVKNETQLDYDSTYFETQYLLKPDHNQPEKANIGDFIADAMHYYVNKYDSIGTHITLIAQGFIREELQPGMQNLEGIFEVTSLGSGNDLLPGYPLSRLFFTAAELKRMLEFIYIAANRDASYYCFFSGIRIDIDPEGRPMNRIKAIYLADKNQHYQLLDYSKQNKELYSFTADAFMMEFFAEVKQMSYGLIRLSPKLANGDIVNNISNALIDIDPYTPGIQEAKIWKSVLEYGTSFSDTNHNGIPDLPDMYRSSNYQENYHIPVNLVNGQ